MNKKGVDERLYLWTFYLVLAIFLFGVLFVHINDIAKGEDFNKDYIARDIALLINTLYASHGNIFVEYPLKKEFYTINIGKFGDRYRVKVNTIERGIPVEYPYAEDLSGEINLKTSFGENYGVNSILFKKGEEVFIEEIETIPEEIPEEAPEKPIEEIKEKFIWPVKEIEMVITSCFGEREGYVEEHEGIDIRTCDEKGDCNKPVRTVADGKVISVLFGDDYWNTINIEHDEGYVTRYLHLESSNVKQGQKVKRGYIIGVAGNHVPVGKPKVPYHLHFTLFINGKSVDPLPYFDMNNLKFTEDSNCYYNRDKYAYEGINWEEYVEERLV